MSCETTALLKEHSKTSYSKENNTESLRNDENIACTDDVEFGENLELEGSSKHGSLVTIFSFWNMLMGTSLLSMPWAFQNAGLAQGICTQLLMCGVAVYTSCILLKSAEKLADPVTKEMPEFMTMCQALIGRWSAWLNILASTVVLLGALIVYWILMVELLFNSVSSVNYFVNLDSHVTDNFTFTSEVGLNGSDKCMLVEPSADAPTGRPKYRPIKGWNEHVTVPLIFIPVFLPILQLRKVTFFARLGAIGTMSVLFLIGAVAVKCFLWGWNSDFSDTDSVHYVPQILGSFPSLSGVLGMGYFLHNSLTTFFKNNKNQKNNIRDVKIGYVLVLLTYCLIGLGVYLTFPAKKSCIDQNFLNNLPWNDALSLAAQLLLFFRMLTVYPIVAYILRVQMCIAIFGKEYPGKLHVAVYNVIIVTSCVLCAMFYPNIGDIIRYAGAFCAMALMFVLPCVCYVIIERRRGEITWFSMFIHGIICVLGIVNFFAQFTVQG